MGSNEYFLLLIGAVAPFVLYLGFKIPRLSLYLLMVLFPLFNIESTTIGGGLFILSWQKLLGGFALVMLLYDVFINGRTMYLFSWHLVLYIGVLILYFVSFVANQSGSLWWFQRYVSNYVFMLIFLNWVRNRKEWDRIILIYIGVLLVSVLYESFFESGEQAYATNAQRIEAAMSNANRAAQGFLLGLGLVTIFVFRNFRAGWKKWAAVVGVGVFIFLLLGAGSRAGFISLLCYMFVLSLLLWPNKNFRIPVLVLLALAVYMIFNPPPVMKKRMKQIPGLAEPGVDQADVEGTRALQYELAFDFIAEKPFLGMGPDVFRYEYNRRVESGYSRPVHSWYLQVATDAGVPALALFVAMFIVTAVFFFLRGWRAPPGSSEKGQFYSLTALTVATIVFGVPSSVAFGKLVFLLFSLAMVAHRWQISLSENEDEDESPDQGLELSDQIESK